MLAHLELALIIMIHIIFSQAIYNIGGQLRVWASEPDLNEPRTLDLRDVQALVKQLHESVFVDGLRAADEHRVLVEAEVLDDFQSQRVGLQNADLSVDGRAVFGIFQQGCVHPFEPQHAAVVVAMEDHNHAPHGVVLWFHDKRRNGDNCHHGERETGHYPLVAADNTPQSRGQRLIRRADYPLDPGAWYLGR